MKRAILILSGLGLFCTIIVEVYSFLSSQAQQQLPHQEAIDIAAVYIVTAMPVLAVIDAILGMIAAARRHTPRWVVAFIVLAIFCLPFYGIGFLASIQGAFADSQWLAVVITVMIYFPNVIFLAAFVFALRLPSLPAGQRQQLAWQRQRL